jgi:hypothetical protein
VEEFTVGKSAILVLLMLCSIGSATGEAVLAGRLKDHMLDWR